MQIKHITVATVLLLLSNAYASPTPDPTTVGDVVNNVVNVTTNAVNDILNWQLPNITITDDVKKFITNVKNGFENAPVQFWQEIKNGTWPQDVQDWLNSLPNNLRADAKQELLELANEHLGNSTSTNSGSSSISDAGAIFTVASIAGIVAIFVSF